MRRDYLEYTNEHRSIHPQSDFFDPELAAHLLADRELAAALLERMDLSRETKSYLVAYGIRLGAETADVLYAALRHQGYSDEAILATDAGLDLLLSLFMPARGDLHVQRPHVLIEAEPRADLGVAVADDAHVAVGQQRARAQLRRQLAVDPDREVRRALPQRLGVVGRVRREAQRDARRLLAQHAVERDAEDQQHVVGRQDDEAALLRLRRERPLRREHLRRAGDDLADPRLQQFGPRRQHHAPAGAHEQRVAELLADPRQRVAHRRRRQPEPRRRPRDAALLQQGVEGDEEAEVAGFHLPTMPTGHPTRNAGRPPRRPGSPSTRSPPVHAQDPAYRPIARRRARPAAGPGSTAMSRRRSSIRGTRGARPRPCTCLGHQVEGPAHVVRARRRAWRSERRHGNPVGARARPPLRVRRAPVHAARGGLVIGHAPRIDVASELVFVSRAAVKSPSRWLDLIARGFAGVNLATHDLAVLAMSASVRVLHRSSLEER